MVRHADWVTDIWGFPVNESMTGDLYWIRLGDSSVPFFASGLAESEPKSVSGRSHVLCLFSIVPRDWDRSQLYSSYEILLSVPGGLG
ncbi:hypothetical protein EYZ11_002758 [Aspergillus tanneri]|uniref:Uncharacterized protein n=1 Tax=Aspergillus tanneri TaxID=1220188 RepID=A0A4S3JQ31_9EURO|nr:hypothetical protein EYZ11_002758 [Aspergillus tanneri]